MNRRERRAAGKRAKTDRDVPASAPAALYESGLRHLRAGRHLDAQIACQQALAIDVNADIPDRLVNVINQRKARWLLDHESDFFLVDEGGE